MIKKVRLKESIAILKGNEEIYNVVFTCARKIKKIRVDNLVKSIIKETKKEKNYHELIKNLSQKYANSDVINALQALQHEGLIRIVDSEIGARQMKQAFFIDEFTSSWTETKEKCNKISNSTIAVFGVGGIGSWMVNGLYQMGVGEIRIVDPDKVEESNLNRQLYYSLKDLGKYKVDVLVNKLYDSNIKPFKSFISRGSNLEEIINGCNFLVNCADKPSVVETTHIINSYASKKSIPYCVAGGYNLHLGMVGPIIIPEKTASFDDFIKYQIQNDPLKNYQKIKDVEDSGNLGPIAGTISNLQLMEIFKHLTGIGRVNYNKFAEIDFINFKITWRRFSKKD